MENITFRTCTESGDVPQASATDEALQNIAGISVYDTNTFQKGVEQQINKVIQQKETADLNNKIQSFSKDIRRIKLLLEQNEKAGSAISSHSFSEATLIKVKSLKAERETYKHQLKVLSAKLTKAQFSLQLHSLNSKDKQNVLKPVDNSKKGEDETLFSKALDKSKVISAKTLQERKALIKKGIDASLCSTVHPRNISVKSASLKLDSAFAKSLLGDHVESQFKKNKVPMFKSSSRQKSKKDLTNNKPVSENFVPASALVTKRQEQELSSNKDIDYEPPGALDHTVSDDGDDADDIIPERVRVSGKLTREKIALDDANPKHYQKRLARHKKMLLRDAAEGYEIPQDKLLDGGLKVPGKIWKRLYKYQKTGVKWLWELHSQKTGGILGDEMGLGKTIQVIALLAALRNSKIHDYDSSYSYDGLGPVLIVAPATVMHQWVHELHIWSPLLRVAVLHNSGSHRGSQSSLISNMVLSRGVVVTSYERVRLALDDLLSKAWHYVILDEGHKIRNPGAGITHAVKMFTTPHRLILSGSPIQNHLRELWSLFDFVFPGKLGTLQVFMEQFSIPIVQGGYANASEIQVQTAYKCACMLRNAIAPYLLRRMKQDVQSHIHLPKKTDQVLFCSLTDHELEVYQKYLDSDTVDSILRGSLKVFVGLIQLRKICNHPDLYTGGHKLLIGDPTPPPGDEKRFGYWKRSGKMIVVESLLRIWKKQQKKVLLFTQSKMMLDILQDFVKSQGYEYVVMHGGTTINSRQPLIKEFNENPNIFVFILTTRVGGLGVNLIGADRVLIYDPDWNPSTDMQAQERAWRIGQTKQVTIYRLLTAGTIEEKIYHRQIFKQFMSNRILKDPKQRRFFKANSLHELFTLGNQNKDPKVNRTETASIFAGTGSEIKVKRSVKQKQVKKESFGSSLKSVNITDVIPAVRTRLTDAGNKGAGEDVPENISTVNCTSSSDTQLASSTYKTLNTDDSNRIEVRTSSVVSNSNKIEGNVGKTNPSNSEVNSTSSACNLNQFISSSEGDETTISCNGASREPCCSYTSHSNRASTSEVIPGLSDSNDGSDAKEPSVSFSEVSDSTDNCLGIANSALRNSSERKVSDLPGNSSNAKSAIKNSLLKVLEKYKQAKREANISRPVEKRKRKLEVDGERVDNIVKKSKYHQRKNEEESSKKADDYVLSRLFRKGVHSAMKHSTIMNSSNPDYAIVESEASRVAKEAVRNLRLSRRQYNYPQNSKRTKPKFGNVMKTKRTVQKRRKKSSSEEDESVGGIFNSSSGPCSSSTLLKRMKLRNHIEKPSEESTDEDEDVHRVTQDEDFTENDKLLRSLTSFVAAQPEAEVTTDQVMRKFGKIDVAQVPNFKSMLHQVCSSRTSFDGGMIWSLKPEFK